MSDSGDKALEDVFTEDPMFVLQIAHSVQDVARALGLEPDKFFYVLQHTDDGIYYKNFLIPKKKGGFREISAPKKGLGLAQTRLFDLLQKKFKPKPSVKGYTKGESFLSNARYHEGQKWVLNIDVKDFFPSITFPRVRGLFMSSYFGFNDRVATILARTCTTARGLPQGARTSPIIANMVAANLDKKLLKIALENKLRYTRYADDITFSSSQRVIPSSVVQSWEPNFGSREIRLGNAVLDAFHSSGFAVNEEKTRLSMSYERQEVTGLVVNKTANLWRNDVSRIRMKLHSAKKFGAAEASKVWIGASATEKDFWAYITGWLAYARQVRGEKDAVVAKLCKMAVLAGLKEPGWVVRSAEMVRECDVFLSHASEDKPKVRRLKDRLEAIGITVFFDEDNIKWGDSITERINRGLLTSSFFVPFLSETFSVKGWTNKELNSAISSNINRKRRILPIKDAGFSIEENYPLLIDTVFREWPPNADEGFIAELADQILAVVQAEHKKTHDLN